MGGTRTHNQCVYMDLSSNARRDGTYLRPTLMIWFRYFDIGLRSFLANISDPSTPRTRSPGSTETQCKPQDQAVTSSTSAVTWRSSLLLDLPAGLDPSRFSPLTSWTWPFHGVCCQFWRLSGAEQHPPSRVKLFAAAVAAETPVVLISSRFLYSVWKMTQKVKNCRKSFICDHQTHRWNAPPLPQKQLENTSLGLSERQTLRWPPDLCCAGTRRVKQLLRSSLWSSVEPHVPSPELLQVCRWSSCRDGGDPEQKQRFLDQHQRFCRFWGFNGGSCGRAAACLTS